MTVSKVGDDIQILFIIRQGRLGRKIYQIDVADVDVLVRFLDSSWYAYTFFILTVLLFVLISILLYRIKII